MAEYISGGLPAYFCVAAKSRPPSQRPLLLGLDVAIYLFTSTNLAFVQDLAGVSSTRRG
jgi:hypothetical protein